MIIPPEVIIKYRIVPEKGRCENEISKTEIKKVKDTFEFFSLQRIYQYHSGVAHKIQDIFRAYPPDLLYDLFQEFKNSSSWENVTKEKMLVILFSEFNVEDPENEILGHLKQDLYLEVFKLYYESWKEIKFPMHE